MPKYSEDIIINNLKSSHIMRKDDLKSINFRHPFQPPVHAKPPFKLAQTFLDRFRLLTNDPGC